MDGFLILDKPTGISSQQALTRVRKALKAKKAGHTGTLDPLATGVLPIALGEATKIIPYLDEARKVYRVTGKLGESTDTYDSDGRLLLRRDSSGIEAETIRRELASFLGSQEQAPPLYSAIKLRGKPLYQYARRGEGVEVAKRSVHFESLELESHSPPEFLLKVACSKGTYVRSLVHDLGEKLGCGAHVVELRRLASGIFSLEGAVGLEEILAHPEEFPARLWSIETLLRDWPRLELESEEELRRTLAGVSLRKINQTIEIKGFSGKRLVLVRGGLIRALIESAPGRDFEYLRVLHREETV